MQGPADAYLATYTCLSCREACICILHTIRCLHERELLVKGPTDAAPALMHALAQQDPMLLRILLGAAAGALAESRVPDISDAIHDMLVVHA
jgi:hypothetical protein